MRVRDCLPARCTVRGVRAAAALTPAGKSGGAIDYGGVGVRTLVDCLAAHVPKGFVSRF